MKTFKQFLMEEDEERPNGLPPSNVTPPYVVSKERLPPDHRSGRFVRDFRGNLTGEIDAYSLPPGVQGTAQYGPPSPDQLDPVTHDTVSNTELDMDKYPEKYGVSKNWREEQAQEEQRRKEEDEIVKSAEDFAKEMGKSVDELLKISPKFKQFYGKAIENKRNRPSMNEFLRKR